MATLVPLSTPRQPFGVLNDSKLRNLQSIKNRQNALTPSSPPNLKRRAPSPELSDSENVDPNLIDSLGKRKRAAFDDDVSLSKPSRYSVHVVPAPPKAISQHPLPTTITTPRIDTFQKPALPHSAPAAAGRSPTRAAKRMSLLKPSSKRFTPALGHSRSSPSLSLSAALKGTLATKRAKKIRTIQESKPPSWSFDIFVESEEVQDYRMNEWTMTQSATILDISDDENKAQEKNDRGKENVDPNLTINTPTPSTRRPTPSSRKNMMTEEIPYDTPRTPLGDLNTSDFYAEGLDATSIVLVHDETEETVPPKEETPFIFEAQSSPLTLTHEQEDTATSIASLLASSTPIWSTFAAASEHQHQPQQVTEINNILDPSSTSLTTSFSSPTDIQIWESESAKDENEAQDHITEESVNLDDAGGFTLQEL